MESRSSFRTDLPWAEAEAVADGDAAVWGALVPPLLLLLLLMWQQCCTRVVRMAAILRKPHAIGG